MMKPYSDLIFKHMRIDHLPHIWCPGCGNGILMRDVAVAIEELKIPREQIVVVSGIGCSSRAAGYLDVNTIHTTHGRAIAFATGIKLAKPDRDDLRIVALPILKTAKEEVGNPMTANILAVGAINTLLELVDDEALLDAVKRNIPRGTEQINLKAYEAGKALGAFAKGRKGARKGSRLFLCEAGRLRRLPCKRRRPYHGHPRHHQKLRRCPRKLPGCGRQRHRGKGHQRL